MAKQMKKFVWLFAVWLALLGWAVVKNLNAHCDTMDGPVIQAARHALETGNTDPALIWVQPADENELRNAFKETLAMRMLGSEARKFADRWFFETLVRLHRAGEGAPFEGLKPSGTPLEPGVAEADHALETGSLDELLQAAHARLDAAIRERFERARSARAHAEHGAATGRDYVAKYVEFVHFVEKAFAFAAGESHVSAPAEAHRHE